MTLKHSYNSTIAEDPASGTPGGLVGPNEWNADHAVSGTSLQTLFNNAGSLTGMSGTSWDNTNLALTITGATVTTSNPILNLSQTWNAGGVTFTALKLNLTNTASHAGSALSDFQVGGVSQFDYYPNASTLELGNSTTATAFHVYNTVDTLGGPTNYERGTFDWTTNSNKLTIGTQAGGTGTNRDVCLVSATGNIGLGPFSGATIGFSGTGSGGNFYIAANSSNIVSVTNNSIPGINFGTSGLFFGSSVSYTGFDVAIFRTAAGVIGLTQAATGAHATGIQVYNSNDNAAAAPTANYERGVFDWTTTSNVLTIGTQNGGTGTLRAVQFVGADFVHGASVATNATDGFIYIPSCAGTPTGTPTTFTGTVPMVYDRTNNKFYIYNGGWKGGTNPGAFT